MQELLNSPLSPDRFKRKNKRKSKSWKSLESKLLNQVQLTAVTLNHPEPKVNSINHFKMVRVVSIRSYQPQKSQGLVLRSRELKELSHYRTKRILGLTFKVSSKRSINLILFHNKSHRLQGPKGMKHLKKWSNLSIKRTCLGSIKMCLGGVKGTPAIISKRVAQSKR